MGYIMDLRKVVGHRPLIMTCAGVLIINKENQMDNLPENITQNNFPAIDRFRRENEKL